MSKQKSSKITAKKSIDAESKKPASVPRFIILLIVVAGLIFNLGIRIRLMDMPLERDEGEFAYIARLTLQGDALYENAYNKKLPGTSLMYALFMGCFGQTTAAIRIGMMCINLVSIVLLFMLSRKLFNETVAAIAAFSFAVFSIDSGVLGNAAHATQFINFISLAGWLVFFKGHDKNSMFLTLLSGIFFGLSILMKQHALFIAGGFFIYAIYSHWQLSKNNRVAFIKHIAVLGIGVLIPVAAIIALVSIQGTLEKFILWVYEYSSSYATSENYFSHAWESLTSNFKKVVSTYKWLWVAGAIGFAALFFDRTDFKSRFFVVISVLSAVLCILPGLLFRNHYFIVLLPWLALCIGIAFNYLSTALARVIHPKLAVVIIILIFTSLSSASIAKQEKYFFELSPERVARKVYGLNPFPEAVVIGEYIKSHASPNAEIAVLGSEAEIYFYSNRKSATGYIYTYGLVDGGHHNLAMQNEMISEIESQKPEYLIYAKVSTSWLVAPGSSTRIFDWLNEYTRLHYRREGVVTIASDGTTYRWNTDAEQYNSTNGQEIYIFRIKG
jgi:4-amino-4-deoxy-L-arabinose transferase-like glycosyltransferase